MDWSVLHSASDCEMGKRNCDVNAMMLGPRGSSIVAEVVSGPSTSSNVVLTIASLTVRVVPHMCFSTSMLVACHFTGYLDLSNWGSSAWEARHTRTFASWCWHLMACGTSLALLRHPSKLKIATAGTDSDDSDVNDWNLVSNNMLA